jgi:ribosomal protein S18 acetylase RimI-like enzyme
MPGNTPVLLDPIQLRPAAALLAAAFLNDPMYIQVQPNNGARLKMLEWLLERVIRYALLNGQVYTTPGLIGVACWLPPGHTHLTFVGLLRSGLIAAPLKLGLRTYLRFDRYMSYADKLHERYAPSSHWYLWAIGVEPTHQGCGVGSSLLQPVLQQANSEGAACYLDTGTESNTRFYARHGFQVVEHGRTPRDGVQVWAMLRLPLA